MNSQRGVRVGVDVGGTFTDLVAVVGGETTTLKVPSTPAAPEAGVLDAVRAALGDDAWTAADVSRFGHGTTVATNAVLEREWADTALVTTAGFRDAVEIGRQDRPDLYDLAGEKPDPVVPRDRRFGVAERLDERGRVLDPLDETDLDRVVESVAASEAEAVAVATLFAFENDAHERAVAERLRERTDAAVSRSSAVHPEIREYERTLLTCLNAALVPVVGEYVADLETGLADAGVDAPLRLMGSHGGLIAAAAARERPVETLLSGPAAGVRGAVHVAERAGLGGDILTMDMGGTSCDVSLVADGDPTVTTEATVGGYPLATPTVDVHTVGSGGGSVAWVDDGGALRVGPRSAGADPGPACYGRGGERPTTTDAHCVLGRIDPRGFVESADDDAAAAAREAVARVAEPLGIGVEEAAAGILAVADASTERAVRVVSVERGHDPREFALVAYGGAGPLHAASVAAALEIPRVLVPRAAGTLSALGLLVSDLRYELSASRVRPLADVDPADLADAYADLVAEGRERLAGDVAPDRRRIERRADLRYRGQSHELTVPVPEDLDGDALGTVAERFHERHERRYGHASPGEPVELVTLRVLARGAVDPPDDDPPAATGDPADAVTETRAVTFDGDAVETRIYDREALPVEAALDGPAVVEGAESTVVVPPGATATVTRSGDLLLEVDP